MTKLACLAFIASFVTACDSGGGDFDGTAAEVEGIYKITTHTRNETACTPGGTQVTGTETFAVAFTQELFGQKLVSMISCANAADCRVKLAATRALEPVLTDFQFAANKIDGDALTGRGASSGSLEGGKCVGGARLDTRFLLGDQTLRIEQKVTYADSYAPKDGICWTDLAEKNADGNSCTEMEVLEAELVEVL